MNSRRLGIVALRTAVFFLVAVILAVITGFSTPAVIAVTMTAAALATQIGGMLWLRRRSRTPETGSSPH